MSLLYVIRVCVEAAQGHGDISVLTHHIFPVCKVVHIVPIHLGKNARSRAMGLLLQLGQIDGKSLRDRSVIALNGC